MNKTAPNEYWHREHSAHNRNGDKITLSCARRYSVDHVMNVLSECNSLGELESQCNQWLQSTRTLEYDIFKLGYGYHVVLYDDSKPESSKGYGRHNMTEEVHAVLRGKDEWDSNRKASTDVWST
jgi:hypothetical protein